MNKQIELHVWLGLTQSGEGSELEQNDWPPHARGHFPADCLGLYLHYWLFWVSTHRPLDCICTLSYLSSLLAHTADFGLINFHSYRKQFLI